MSDMGQSYDDMSKRRHEHSTEQLNLEVIKPTIDKSKPRKIHSLRPFIPKQARKHVVGQFLNWTSDPSPVPSDPRPGRSDPCLGTSDPRHGPSSHLQ